VCWVAQQPREARPGEQVERGAEGQLRRRQPALAQPGRARRVGADHRQHGLAGLVQGEAEPLEEQFGAAVDRAGHDLGHPGHAGTAGLEGANGLGERMGGG